MTPAKTDPQPIPGKGVEPKPAKSEPPKLAPMNIKDTPKGKMTPAKTDPQPIPGKGVEP